ncbi:carbon monoxide dehydrogenase [Sporosarcina sp. Te-1]|uniref:carbon monoxide dehydrogenase n=1 Tax=Sporosarcina sp. Te-1 TaxID=2818390 RepID=UPI001A9F88E7|nr:carbon monoxide dehydrogenase [Sporosarcina sp. Te-1]QTD41837.1 carbon monoxide dehydrogenase [Sporosarcina sp. Te-1]
MVFHKIKFVMVPIFLSFPFVTTDIVDRPLKEDIPSFEENYAQAGYKSVDVAVHEFEGFCKCKVELPDNLPSGPFTHKFGRFFKDVHYNVNSSLGIRYVHNTDNQSVYKIDIRPSKDKLSFTGTDYLLKDKSIAVYFDKQMFHFLAFEENGLQYLLGIHKSISNHETPSILVQIANSMK